MIPTPNVYLPLAVARDFADGLLPTLDGTRTLRVTDRAAAFELCTYVTMALLQSNRAWNAFLRAGEKRDDSSIAWLAWVDHIQGQRQVATLLPIMADLYELHRLPTSAAPEWMKSRGLAWHQLRETNRNRIIRFDQPSQWRYYAAELRETVERELRENGTVTDGPPPSMGIEPVTLATLIVIGLGFVTFGVVAYLVNLGVGRICDYFAQEQTAINGRLACFDAHMERWLATGDEREKEAMLLCHEQAEQLSRPNPVWTLLAVAGGGILISLIWSRRKAAPQLKESDGS